MTTSEKKIVEALRVNAESPGKRRWNCLNDEQIAAYADQRVPEAQKQRIETHLASCDYCLGQLGFLAKVAHSQVPEEVPAYLLPRGLEVGKAQVGGQAGFGWRWKASVSVAAAAACVVIISVVTLREPAPQVPVAKPPINVQAPPTEERPAPPSQESAFSIRGTTRPASQPNLLFPRRGMAISRDSLEFRWDAVPGARYYDVTVANADGDLVWNSQADKNSVKVPSGLGFTAGARYFVWVQAHFSQGKSVRSETVAFTISGQP
jgi:Putative zinc-finger